MALAITTFRPREGFIVNGGFRTFPVFGESLQSRTQIGGLDFINAAIMQRHHRIFGGDFRKFPAHGFQFRRRQLRQFVDNLGCAHGFNLVCNGRFAMAFFVVAQASCLCVLKKSFRRKNSINQNRTGKMPVPLFNTAAEISPSARARGRGLCARRPRF